MKSWIALLAICLTSSAVMMRPRQTNHTPTVVHAGTTCDATSLNAAYGYRMDGNFFDNQGYTNYLSAAGMFVGDGQGNLSFKDTISLDGGITQNETYTGTYTVNSDCTGHMDAASPGAGVTLGYDFTITSNGNEIQMINTNGTNATATAKKQFPPVTTATTSDPAPSN